MYRTLICLLTGACAAPPLGPDVAGRLEQAAAGYDTLAAALRVHDPAFGADAGDGSLPLFGPGDSLPSVASIQRGADSLLELIGRTPAEAADSSLVPLHDALASRLREMHARTRLLSGEGLTIEEARALQDVEPRAVSIARTVSRAVSENVPARRLTRPRADAPAVTPGRLVVPVRGVRSGDLVDTYTQARAAGRSHNAIDIMAPKGSEVVAATSGRVVRLFISERGGTTLYQLGDDERTVYYYAHLDSYAVGMTAGVLVKPGTLLGYVGDTGNAMPGNYHLHFAMWTVDDPRRYWDGETINPYPLLQGDSAPQR